MSPASVFQPLAPFVRLALPVDSAGVIKLAVWRPFTEWGERLCRSQAVTRHVCAYARETAADSLPAALHLHTARC